jgi:hypothetical protein
MQPCDVIIAHMHTVFCHVNLLVKRVSNVDFKKAHVDFNKLMACVALLLWLQVMLAQQRTIIQLVELVNVLHGEAASLVSKLTGQQPVTPTELQHMQQQPQQLDQAGDEGCDRQLAADQQLVQERWVWVAGSGCP